MKSSRAYLCGVPDLNCSGGRLITDQALQHTKFHSSPEDAFNCMVRYLTKEEGYTRIGSREFFKEGFPVRVLTKKIRYGGVLRRGKEKRYMPKDRTAGLITG